MHLEHQIQRRRRYVVRYSEEEREPTAFRVCSLPGCWNPTNSNSAVRTYPLGSFCCSRHLNNYLKCLIWDNLYLNQDLQSLN